MSAPAPSLLVGPVLRRVVGTRATIWVETSHPVQVEIRAGDAGGTAHTFTAYGHHYALVVVDGLPPAAATPYQVSLDGQVVWPEPDSPFPASAIRTREDDDSDQPVRLVFGSCRESTQHAVSHKLRPDALDAYARRLAADHDGASWPDLLVLLGDQVYADETSPAVRRWLARRRRRPDAPSAHVVTYEEYTRLYYESWRDPEIRYLFSTVPSVMIFDDHEIIDDWNSSAAWKADARRQPWWAERIVSGLASYWVYQHLGNLSPDEIATDAVYTEVLANAEDATTTLAKFAAEVDATPEGGYQWSYSLDIGATRLVVLDNRCSRVVEPGRRAMVPEREWRWFAEQAHGRYEHLVLGCSLPWLLPPGVHHLETWNEQVAQSPRRGAAAAAEKLRRLLDLEHWGAFRRSFERLAALFGDLGAGAIRPGRTVGLSAGAPASISVLSGDVHHSYVARADLGPTVTTPVYQLTCSPLHNQVPAPMRPFLRLGWSGPMTSLTRRLARAVGVPPPPVSWRKLAGPYFGNAVATLVHTGRDAHVTIEGTARDGSLIPVADQRLTP